MIHIDLFNVWLKHYTNSVNFKTKKQNTELNHSFKGPNDINYEYSKIKNYEI